jgi:hypothetical protein
MSVTAVTIEGNRYATRSIRVLLRLMNQANGAHLDMRVWGRVLRGYLRRVTLPQDYDWPFSKISGKFNVLWSAK